MALVIFDCDGTLVDSQHLIVATMRAVWNEIDRPLPDDALFRGVIGLSLQEAVARLLPDLAPHDHIHLAERYRAWFAQLRTASAEFEPLFPGTIETLNALSGAGHLLGVATGKSRRGLRTVLEHYDLLHLFAVTRTAEDAPSKPHPGMVLDSLAELQIPATECAVVGDTTFDIEMARAARVCAIGVAWGYHTAADLHAAGASVVLTSFAELPPRVEVLFGA